MIDERRADAFLLGYLPQLVHGQFDALELCEVGRPGARGELAARVEKQLRGLPVRGPEIVSAVWHVEAIVGDRLRVEPPAPPRSGAECAAWSRAVAAAFETRFPDAAAAAGVRAAYDLGVRAGAAETLVHGAARLHELLAVAPEHAGLVARAAGARAALQVAAALPAVTTDDPTVRAEGATITRELAGAVAAAARPPGDAVAAELEELEARLGRAARSLEAAQWGTPRTSVRDWHEQTLSGSELQRRLAGHLRWSVPCRLEPDGHPAPRLFAFDKRVLMAFSDEDALAARPAFLRDEKPEDQLHLTLPGTALLSWLPDENVDVLVLDPTDDPAAPLTINYPAELHPHLHRTAEEVAVALAFCDWSRLDPAPLRAARLWILVSGSVVKNLLAPDGYGRPRAAVFTCEAALDAHLERATPEQRLALSACQRLLLPGHALFPELAKLDVIGMVVDPSGPGRSRAFNDATLSRLAAAPPG